MPRLCTKQRRSRVRRLSGVSVLFHSPTYRRRDSGQGKSGGPQFPEAKTSTLSTVLHSVFSYYVAADGQPVRCQSQAV